MCSCTTRKLHVSRAIAIPGYAAQVSVRAGSVIAHLASLNMDVPILPFARRRAFRTAARQTGLSLRPRNLRSSELTVCGPFRHSLRARQSPVLRAINKRWFFASN